MEATVALPMLCSFRFLRAFLQVAVRARGSTPRTRTSDLHALCAKVAQLTSPETEALGGSAHMTYPATATLGHKSTRDFFTL